MRATPPKVSAALVVTLPTMALSGGQANEATPRTKRATPTQTNAFEAGKLCAELAGGVFLGCAEFGVGAGFFVLGKKNWSDGVLE